MLIYSNMIYSIGSIILVASTTSVLCCHHTTTPNNTAENITTEAPQDSCTLLSPNDYVDKLINELKNKTIDTIPLPDDPGSTSLKEGQVWGLSSLERAGNATVQCNTTLTTVEVLLKFEELKGRYNWERKVLLKKFSGSVFIKADTAVILFRVSQEHGNDTKLTLEKFSIKILSGIKTDITGLGIVSWAISIITEPAANLFKKSLVNMVEGPLKKAIGLALKDIDVPLY